MSDTTAELGILQLLTEAGWAFYRLPARQRADDQLVRARVSEFLGRAVARLAARETATRAAIPVPSRSQPLPDAALLTAARALKTLRESVAALDTRVRGAAAPPDRDATTLVLSEAQCASLVGLDAALIGAARAVEMAADGGDVAAALAALEKLAQLRAGLIAWR